MTGKLTLGLTLASLLLLQNNVNRIRWENVLTQPAAWYSSEAAMRIADNVLAYQRSNGGWPKDIDMAQPLDKNRLAEIRSERDRTDTTIDNGATVTQLRLLSKVSEAAGRQEIKTAFLAGMDYLLSAQYRNGGWPQYFPLRKDYSRHITFNDDAMIGVMTLLKEVSAGERPYAFVDAGRRQAASRAIDQGLRVILDTQVRVNGRLTVWCAQHDEQTLAPRGARSYEHPSLSGSESAGIVQYLMQIPKPSPEIVSAIENAVAWFQAAEIKGQRLITKADNDRFLQLDPAARGLWARFYEISTNRPIFSGRDGIIKYRLDEIELERRAGYSWIGPYALNLLEKDYPAWKKRTQ